MARRKKKGRLSKSSTDFASALNKAKPTTHEKAESYLTAPRIGLGLESKLKAIRKIRKEDIRLDKNTQINAPSEHHHVLYTAGWTLSEEIHE